MKHNKRHSVRSARKAAVYWGLMVRGANSGSKESTCLSEPPPLLCTTANHCAPLCTTVRLGQASVPWYGKLSCTNSHQGAYMMPHNVRVAEANANKLAPLVELSIVEASAPLPLLQSACGCINCLHAAHCQMSYLLCK